MFIIFYAFLAISRFSEKKKENQRTHTHTRMRNIRIRSLLFCCHHRTSIDFVLFMLSTVAVIHSTPFHILSVILAVHSEFSLFFLREQREREAGANTKATTTALLLSFIRRCFFFPSFFILFIFLFCSIGIFLVCFLLILRLARTLSLSFSLSRSLHSQSLTLCTLLLLLTCCLLQLCLIIIIIVISTRHSCAHSYVGGSSYRSVSVSPSLLLRLCVYVYVALCQCVLASRSVYNIIYKTNVHSSKCLQKESNRLVTTSFGIRFNYNFVCTHVLSPSRSLSLRIIIVDNLFVCD